MVKPKPSTLHPALDGDFRSCSGLVLRCFGLGFPGGLGLCLGLRVRGEGVELSGLGVEDYGFNIPGFIFRPGGL